MDTETRGKINPDATRVKQLAASIEQNGLMQPVTVREVDGKYEIVDGHRRFMEMTIDWTDQSKQQLRDIFDYYATVADLEVAARLIDSIFCSGNDDYFVSLHKHENNG